jgi:hypothetical protein
MIASATDNKGSETTVTPRPVLRLVRDDARTRALAAWPIFGGDHTDDDLGLSDTKTTETGEIVCICCNKPVPPNYIRPARIGTNDCMMCGQPEDHHTKPAKDANGHARRSNTAPNRNDEESFWSSSQQLRDLRQFARARMVGPWAMLGNCLARVVSSIPPHVVLPPTIGSHASLNLFVALVGKSGDTKSTAMRAAADWLKIEPDYAPTKPGSGEGLAKCFAYVRKLPANQGGGYDQVGKQWSVLAKIPEVETLSATAARGGATIMGTLREGWSGERLGTDYAGDERRIVLADNRYRLCLVIGVQPAKAGPLFDDADGGTPQRFVWLPTTDPGIPDVEPGEPPPLDLGRWIDPPRPATNGSIVAFDADNERCRKLSEPADPSEFVVLDIPETAREQIKQTRRAIARGDESVDPLDSHKLLCRLKIAAALMALEGRRQTITENDWQRAGIVVAVSDATRKHVLDELNDRSVEENTNRGFAAGVRDDIAEQVKLERKVKRVSENIARLLIHKFPGHAARAEVRKRLNSRDREYLEDAEGVLIDAGRIEKLRSATNTGSDGYILRLADQ